MKFSIPKEVEHVVETLTKGGYDAYLVGGCTRDLLIGRTPKDWDVTTNATPEQITALFPDESFYNNDFGTVGVTPETEDESLKVIEVTPYRSEEGYTDSRRPDKVSFGCSLEDDLSRRDFTVNAIAYDPSKKDIVDLYKGQEDLRAKVLRTVGDPDERFKEDALRMMRAIRLSAELDFALDGDTAAAIAKNSDNLSHISKERIRDEFSRILLSKQPMMAVVMLQKLGLLPHIAPDLERGIGVEQNQAHMFDVFEHLIRTMQHGADKDWDLTIRLAGLFHDVSKPETRRFDKDKQDYTFHGHEVVGARVTKKALENLKYPKKIVEKVTKLVRWHMFFSDPDQITLSAVRRMIRNVGEENIWDLLNLRICDRIGTGRPKEQPFRFRKYKSFVEEALRDPISVQMLKVDGQRLMELLHVKPGPKIGYILHSLLEEVLDDPSKNTAEILEKRAIELNKMDLEELKKLADAGKKKQQEEESKAIKEIRDKHHVS
ncbi:MAG: CCA tRNA nucleotidyltransferase [Patescibacteria group bacterium UBA2103]